MKKILLNVMVVRVCCWLCAAMSCVVAAGEVRVRLVDMDLGHEEVRLVGLRVNAGEGEMQFFDSGRRYQRMKVGEYLRIMLVETEEMVMARLQAELKVKEAQAKEEEAKRKKLEAEAMQGLRVRGNVFIRGRVIQQEVVEDDVIAEKSKENEKVVQKVWLRDGQILTGTMKSVNEDGDLVWESGFGFEMVISLDDVVQLQKTVKMSRNYGDADKVWLANGDVLKGFVDEVDAKHVVFDADGAKLKISWAQVAGVYLANTYAKQKGLWANLKDGSRVLLRDLILKETVFECVTMKGKTITLDVGTLERIDLPSKRRLVDLSELKYEVASGGDVFGVPFEPEFAGEGELRLHAPVMLRFELPKGALRFTGLFVVPAQASDRADMVLVVGDGQRELLRQGLSARKQSVGVNVPLSGKTMILGVEEGVHGPVLDRLVGKGLMVLVGE